MRRRARNHLKGGVNPVVGLGESAKKAKQRGHYGMEDGAVKSTTHADQFVRKIPEHLGQGIARPLTRTACVKLQSWGLTPSEILAKARK